MLSAIERRDQAHDKAALADERAKSSVEVVKRDRNAVHIH